MPAHLVDGCLQPPCLVCSGQKRSPYREVDELVDVAASDPGVAPQIRTVRLGPARHEIARISPRRGPPPPPVERDRRRWVQDPRAVDLAGIARSLQPPLVIGEKLVGAGSAGRLQPLTGAELPKTAGSEQFPQVAAGRHDPGMSFVIDP